MPRELKDGNRREVPFADVTSSAISWQLDLDLLAHIAAKWSLL
jgi:hypothetical protein